MWQNILQIMSVLRLLLALIVSIAGCGTDERPYSLIDARRVVAIQVEPPEMLPGEDFTVQALVADPTPETELLEVAVIGCTAFEGVVGCLEMLEVVDEDDIDPETGEVSLDEADYRELVEGFVRRGQVSPARLTTEVFASLTAPANYALLLTELELNRVDASVMVLVCRPKLCPALDAIDAYLEQAPGAPEGLELVMMLSDPDLLMAGTPIEGVGLARKSYRVSFASPRARNHNPGINLLDAGTCVAALEATKEEDRACSLGLVLSTDSLEIYTPDESSTAQSQEALSVRFYSNTGVVSPRTAQIYPSSQPSYTTTLLLPSQEATLRPVGIWAVVVDSRGGAEGVGVTVE